MARRQRDYHAEYLARLRRAADRGEQPNTRVATGHARLDKGEVPISIQNAIRDGRASRVFRGYDTAKRTQVANSLKKTYPDKSLHEIWTTLLGS